MQGCTIQSLALRSVDSLFDNTVAALMREGDLQFAESAIAGDMKLLEGVVDSDPTNVKYLQLACMGFASYALAFAEDVPARVRRSSLEPPHGAESYCTRIRPCTL